jgi:hypothetical protein
LVGHKLNPLNAPPATLPIRQPTPFQLQALPPKQIIFSYHPLLLVGISGASFTVNQLPILFVPISTKMFRALWGRVSEEFA